MASVRLDSLSSTLPDGVIALHPISLEVRSGEALVLLGDRGAGKSAVLRLIAGLDDPSGGALYIDDRHVAGTPPKHRGVGMVLEGGGLYPHLTVEGMIGLSLRVARTPREDVRARVDEIARLLDIPNILHRRPNELTSVDRALVAVARAASRRPGVLLFDEPLGMLDGAARRRVRDAITTVQREGDAALFYATARTDEGLTFGGQVAILHERRL